ncbi:FAD-dependent oxidoreductase [Cryobacterium sp. TMT1-21]|uniref:FAD-dependent oxidoreductase n=1 Tax=Cryobacterium shii TaxID=1259235 RepID=A0AAQ2C4F5_9MICO|nr:MULTISPECIES: FAD-dependent oxidoreductase [Cryobacterium]TFC42562.1 FAD-dependent oxidoreductase [Cryobacterium shii]TFD13179.1 FAD-dependent oxidoreductase [Cryobacterium sp. TMT1-21]TFD18600.1 FAD-dependent oxidoreductase [Cryobacterium sp. TMT4-10]TFD36676.1 FAD-dependent oxidoreductase [Cryobacterium sp. TMT2-10]
MDENVETVVIGGGAMGSATAWQLVRRGRPVTLLERFEPGHLNGASHGASRNFNTAYADPTYVGMLAEALPLWRELEEETGSALLAQVGVVNHGANPAFDRVAEALTGAGLGAEFLVPEAAAERWPGIRFDGRVLHNPDAGRLNADAAVTALQAAAVAAGASVRHGVRVLRLDVQGDDRVRVTHENGSITARRVVVTVGAWTSGLLAGVLATPRLTVTQEQPAHFALRDTTPAALHRAGTEWPGFNHAPDRSDPRYAWWYSPVYGMYTPGQGVKAGWHGVGPGTDPDARSFRPEPVQLAALQRYVREWLPGADADVLEPVTCTYTTTVDEDFVLDRVGPVIVGAGFSGHGFKFTPSVGRILADLVTGAAPAPSRFALNRTPNAGPGGWLARA